MRPHSLVSCDWLEAHLDHPELRLFDCTATMGPENHGKKLHYDRNHIRAAAYLDVASPESLLSNPSPGQIYGWPAREQAERAASEAGIKADSLVVLYAAPPPGLSPAAHFWATRAWWILSQLGVNCAVLDGGWEKWSRENRPTDPVQRYYSSSDFNAPTYKERAITTRDDVVCALGDRRTLIVDALSAASFRGELQRGFAARRGHIAGAINIPFDAVIDPDTGCFLPPDRLANVLLALGWRADARIITYCGGGVAATQVAFALRLIGCDDVSVYSPGLSEWASDPSLPMRTTD